MKYDLIQIPLRTFKIFNKKTVFLSAEERAEEYFNRKGFYFVRGAGGYKMQMLMEQQIYLKSISKSSIKKIGVVVV